MIGGYIKLHRSIFKNPIVCKDADYLAVWVWLLGHACFAPTDVIFNGERRTLEAGQLTTGRKEIANALKVSESKVQRILKAFENEEQIEQVTDFRCRLITISSWDKYQLSEQLVDSSRTSPEQLMNTKEEYKNVKNKNSILSGTPDTAIRKGKALTDTCKIVISHLNEATGANYKPGAKYLKVLIGARLADGYTLEDFLTVIDRQVAKWGTDPKMREYLRPKTLFTPANFDSYLNAPASEEELKKEKDREQREYYKGQLKIELAKLNKLTEYLKADPANKELIKAFREQKSKVDWLEEGLK